MSTASPRRTALRAAAAAAAIALCSGLLGCQPEPAPTASTPGATPTASASPGSPSPTESERPSDAIELPAACEQLYSPAMLASLQQRAPLNDPGVTMTSTQVVEALEVLSSGIPTIRCSWGLPSESGMATNVSLVDADQAAVLLDAFANAGFACESSDEGTVCRHLQTMVDLDDNIVELTETHVLRANAWVSTATVNFATDGYTEDIVATLWG